MLLNLQEGGKLMLWLHGTLGAKSVSQTEGTGTIITLAAVSLRTSLWLLE